MLTLWRDGITVEVTSDPLTEEWVSWRSKHFFAEPPRGTVRTGWRVFGGKEYTPASFGPTVGKCPATLTVSAAQRDVVIDAPPGKWRSLHVLRAVRHLMRWSIAEDRPTLFLHGAALAESQSGRGFCILGPSRAGKSILSYKLLGRGFDWISQDDLCLVQREDQRLRVLGWPGSLRIRRDGLGKLPALHAIEPTLAHPVNSSEACSPSPEARLHLFPEELADHLGCGVVGEATVSAFFILDPQAEETLCEPADYGLTKSALLAAWDVLPERRAGAQVAEALLGAAPWRDMVFNPALLDAFGVADIAGAQALIDAAAATIPAWRIGRNALLVRPFPSIDWRVL